MKIQAMPCTGRMEKRHGDVSPIPAGDGLVCIQSDTRHTLFDALCIMLEPIRHKKRLAVHALDDVLQGIELTVMDVQNGSIIRVDCAVRHLGELAR